MVRVSAGSHPVADFLEQDQAAILKQRAQLLVRVLLLKDRLGDAVNTRAVR